MKELVTHIARSLVENPDKVEVLSSEEITVDSNMQSLMAIDVASATSLAETITTNNMAKKGYTKTLSKKKN